MHEISDGKMEQEELNFRMTIESMFHLNYGLIFLGPSKTMCTAIKTFVEFSHGRLCVFCKLNLFSQSCLGVLRV